MPYHINPRTGNIRSCKATTKPCPYADIWHSNTKAAAEDHLEDLYEQYGAESGSLNEWLQPQGSSDAGFMGVFENYETLKAQDEATLAAYGTTTQQLGELLERFNKISSLHRTQADAFPKSVADPQFPEDLYIAVTPNFGSRGSQDCPFEKFEHKTSCRKAASSSYVTIESRHGKIETNQLMGHLIREHGFFQGEQSTYRVDPARLAQAFGFTKKTEAHTDAARAQLSTMRAKNNLPQTQEELDRLIAAVVKTGDGLGEKVGPYTVHQVNHDSEYGRTTYCHAILQKDGSDDIVRLPYTRTETNTGIVYEAKPEHARLVKGQTVQRPGYAYQWYQPVAD